MKYSSPLHSSMAQVFFCKKTQVWLEFFSKKVELGRLILEYFVKYPSPLNLRMDPVFLAKNVDQAD